MRRRRVIAIVGVGASTALAATSAAGSAPVAPSARSAAPAVGQLMASVLRTTRAPGGVMLVTDGARTRQAARGVANLKTRAPMRIHHRFRVASITKMFVASVVLQLVAEGRLALDDPVERWLPGQLPGGAGITIRHLLSHTSGLVGVGGIGQVPPGAFHYSDSNYVLLGSIIGAATGLTVKRELEQRILRPLRLRDTVWPTTPTVPRLAHGYGAAGDATVVHPGLITPASGLVSTAANVGTFMRTLLRGRLLPPAQLGAMETLGPPAVGESYDAYGLGLMYVSSPCPMWGHRGRLAGYTSWALADARGKRIVVALINGGNIGNFKHAAVTRLVASAVCS